jgi:hypothetical protein
MEAELCQGHPSAGAPEQGAAALPFQLADLPADVRLHGLALSGDLGKATRIGHFQEQLEILNLHGGLSYAKNGITEILDRPLGTCH